MAATSPSGPRATEKPSGATRSQASSSSAAPGGSWRPMIARIAGASAGTAGSTWCPADPTGKHAARSTGFWMR